MARGVRARGSVAEAREAFRGRAEALARPCSLLDGGDSRGVTGLVMELALAQPDRVPELHRLFFTSPAVLAFAAARLHAWAAVCALRCAPGGGGRSGSGDPPRRRPRGILRRLGLLGPPLDLRATLKAVAVLDPTAAGAQQRRTGRPCDPAAARGGLIGGGGGCSAYYSDPLQLSPFHALQSRYLFVERALRAPAAGCAAHSCPADSSDSEEDWGTSSDSDHGGSSYSGGSSRASRHRRHRHGQAAPAPGVALWERLAARVCARAAGGKLRLLL